MTQKKLPILISCLLGTAFLSACGSSQDSSESSFSQGSSESSFSQGSSESSFAQDSSESSSSQGEENGLEIVKAMVADIRTLPTTVIEPFEAQSDQISQAFEGDSGASLMAIAEASEAISGAVEAYFENENLRSFIHPENNIPVVIDSSGPAPTFTVDQRVLVQGELVAVDLAATAAFSYASAESVEQGIEVTTESADVNFMISGSSEANDSSLAINSGILVLQNLESSAGDNYTASETEGVTSEAYDEFEIASFDSFEIAMNATLSEAGAEAASFTGEIGFSMYKLNSQDSSKEVSTFGVDQYGWADEFSSVIGFESAQFKIAGDFTAADSTQIHASLVLTVEPGDFVQSCEVENSYSEQEGSLFIEDCTEETENNYVDMSFLVSISLDQTGVLPDVSVMLSGERTGLETLDLTAEIISGSTILDMDLSYEDQEVVSMEITNQALAIATMQYVQDDEMSQPELTGSISYKGVEYATISDELGFVAVSYTDGQNESF